MGYRPVGGIWANPNLSRTNFYIFYSNENPNNSYQQQQVLPGFNMVINTKSSNSLGPDHMQQQVNKMPGAQANIQAYIGQALFFR